MNWVRAAWVCLGIAILAGCAGMKTYSSSLPENLHLHTVIDPRSKMTSVVAEFDIYRVDASCQTEHQGRVYLDKPETHVGIPVGEPLYLGFIFAAKGFLSPDISAVRYNTMLTARAGYEYSVQVSYVRGIYNVEIRETRIGTAMSRIIERRPLSACEKA